MPTVEEIVEEARRAREEKMASLVRLADLAAALGLDRSHVMKIAKRMGITYAYRDIVNAAYLTREDAARLAERLA